MNTRPRWTTSIALVAVALVTSACFVKIVNRDLEEVEATDGRLVESPARVFLEDGSVVLFPDGMLVRDDAIRARSTDSGTLYDIAREPVGPVGHVELDRVVGIEALSQTTDVPLSLTLSAAGTVLTGFAVAGAGAAIFGSCPTVYSEVDGAPVLDAETFSYSISPLLEARDVDRLSARAAEDGTVEIEIRNEALETHHLNHLSLLEVRHAPDRLVLTDGRNAPVSLGTPRSVDAVRDRDGRDLAALLAAADDRVAGSSAARMARTSPAELRDWLEFTLPAVASDSAAVVLRLRNSLLTTTLFYDFMLARQGARALDWIARDIEQIGTAVELGHWVQRHMGMRIEVEEDGRFVEVGRLGDPGPIAWKEVALVVPVRADRPTRVRLTFLADQWRVDRLAWTPDVHRPEVLEHAPEYVSPHGMGASADLLGRILEPDERYLTTTMGTHFDLGFAPGPVDDGGTRTFFLASQGYYTEWVRPSWIRSAETPERFVPTDDVLPELMAHWNEIRDDMEARFHATRIPVARPDVR